jgi:hypothetical protein
VGGFGGQMQTTRCCGRAMSKMHAAYALREHTICSLEHTPLQPHSYAARCGSSALQRAQAFVVCSGAPPGCGGAAGGATRAVRLGAGVRAETVLRRVCWQSFGGWPLFGSACPCWREHSPCAGGSGPPPRRCPPPSGTGDGRGTQTPGAAPKCPAGRAAPSASP